MQTLAVLHAFQLVEKYVSIIVTIDFEAAICKVSEVMWDSDKIIIGDYPTAVCRVKILSFLIFQWIVLTPIEK